MDYKLSLAEEKDIPGILALQDLYHISKVDKEQMDQGFVTTPFTIPQLEEIIAQRGLFVANSNDKIVSYVFAGSWQYFSQWPIFQDMIKQLPLIKVGEIQADVNNSFQYGPICIHTEYRGTSLLKDIFEFMRDNMKERYPLALSFINQLNKRSYNAHTQKLGWQVIKEFNYGDHSFYFIGRKL